MRGLLNPGLEMLIGWIFKKVWALEICELGGYDFMKFEYNIWLEVRWKLEVR
jgi:hypothetical protein